VSPFHHLVDAAKGCTLVLKAERKYHDSEAFGTALPSKNAPTFNLLLHPNLASWAPGVHVGAASRPAASVSCCINSHVSLLYAVTMFTCLQPFVHVAGAALFTSFLQHTCWRAGLRPPDTPVHCLR
jgi:hypothetical protein